MLNEKIDELTPKEKILETLQAILYRIDKIEDKLDQLNDPHNLNGYFRARNVTPDIKSYKLSDHFDSTGAPI